MGLKEVIEEWKGESVESILRCLYIEKHMSPVDIANELKVSQSNIYNWLREYKIHRVSWRNKVTDVDKVNKL